jgi:D-proline reductase (dithiol) PrdB
MAPIPYIARTARYYAALGYTIPYRWAQHDDVPFHRLAQPLARSRIALITTATPIATERHTYDAAGKFFTVYSGDTATEHDLRINHVAIDFQHTTGADQASYFPLQALRRAVAPRGSMVGRIGALTARFHGAPTNRSQRVTRETDAPAILARCQEDGADAAILVPNCPVCHQTVSLVARHLEANGIATVIMGCAKDIVELCGVPRFLFSDFPLGNAAGKPHDIASQDRTLSLALDLLEQATAPRTTRASPLRWSESDAWKRDYGNIDGIAPEERDRLRAEFDAGKATAKARRET